MNETYMEGKRKTLLYSKTVPHKGKGYDELENHHVSITIVIIISGKTGQWMLTLDTEQDVNTVSEHILTRW